MQGAPKRKSWEFGRFLRTATFYDALIPKLPFIPKFASSRQIIKPGAAIWVEGDSNAQSQSQVQLSWGPLDDGKNHVGLCIFHDHKNCF